MLFRSREGWRKGDGDIRVRGAERPEDGRGEDKRGRREKTGEEERRGPGLWGTERIVSEGDGGAQRDGSFGWGTAGLL